MKSLLIIFAVLLLLLTLLSTFGGSIRPGEPFTDGIASMTGLVNMPGMSGMHKMPSKEHSESFYNSTAPAIHMQSQMPSQEHSESFYNSTAPAIPMQSQMPEMQQVSEQYEHAPFPSISENYNNPLSIAKASPPQFTMPTTKQKQKYTEVSAMAPMSLSEGFDIEPFEKENDNLFASF